MKYAFFGSPDFAAVILEELVKANMPPALVVANPDKPFGRKKILTPPPVKLTAENYGIKVWQPDKLGEHSSELSGEWDAFVVAAYAKIIPAVILKLPKKGTIGVHPSLLPKYRGATPIQSAILSGDAETGTTIFLLDEKLDHGPILSFQNIIIAAEDTYESLSQKLSLLSADLLIQTMPSWLRGKITPKIQDEDLATYTKKFLTEDGRVDLNKDEPLSIHNKIRALNPNPGVFTFASKNGKNFRLKLLKSKVEGGQMEVLEVQFEGKKKKTGRWPIKDGNFNF